MNEQPNIGIALSGGVGYCLAHIGVLKALEEENLAVEVIAGTSGGALIGCLYASGIRAARLEEIAANISWSKLMAPTRILTRRGLVSAEPIEKLVDELIGKDRRFCELKLPLSVVTVDLISGAEVVFPGHPDDLIAPAVRASCSVPVVFAPLRMGNWLLADGGIMDPLPVKPLKKFDPRLTVGVVFNTGRYEPSNLFEIGLRAMVLASDRLLELYENDLDLLIRCDTGEISNWDLKTAISLIDVGYRAAKQSIGKLKNKMAEKGLAPG